MGKEIERDKQKNFDNIKIGFLLELQFRQDTINKQLRDLSCFFEDNQVFFNTIDLSCMTQGIDNFIDLFYNFTGLIFKDVDYDENYCKYHKDFY